MTAQLGGASLLAGLLAAAATVLLWLRVALSGAPARPARIATWLLLASAATACGLLEWALVRHDFSVRYVAENGGRDVPLYYTITSLWAALDGSLLLWLLVLAACAALLVWTGDGRAGILLPWAVSVVGVVAVFFFALTYFAANPFTSVSPVPLDGPGPNPLLRVHPAMGVHPPLLYAGYVGLAVPFGYALAALLAGRADDRSIAAMRRWTLGAWSLLTAGITLGAWWSYAVLGWGGYWAWDPVENASLLPWLTATALLHTLRARHRPGCPPPWSLALAAGTFLLVLVGTFLTRSGAVESVHAFTASPLGPMLLGFVLLATAVTLGLLLWRSGVFPTGPAAPLLSREAGYTTNAVLMVALAAVVLTGTLFPLLTQAVGGARTAVGQGYFNRAAVPVALAVLVLMGAAPYLSDRRRRGTGRAGWAAAAGLATATAVGLLSRPGPAALAAFALAAFVLAGLALTAAAQLRHALAARRTGRPAAATLPRQRWGWLLAHAGVAVLAVGVAASSDYTATAERQLAIGETVSAGPVTARLTGVERSGDGDGMSAVARVALYRDGDQLAVAAPRLRYYPARDLAVSLPAITSRPGGDVYVTVLAVPTDGRSATIRLAVNPLVWLVWAGGGLIAVGGLLALVRRRPVGRPGAALDVAGAASARGVR
ncbi:heme lyase CcmF/NrfE family subunit [Phytohabitans kaempferiae]|uniref:Heme lyase CcmF/NrfE family subunit n=1 Tax=Phytohabitans kaempferiae TaxID=1620943 RepID=A0ABV6MAG7_9ACTN